MMRRLAGLALAICIQFSAAVALAGDDSEPGPINRAGEQRMLTQRIVKSYSQLGLNVMPAVALLQMTDAITRFEDNLGALKPLAVRSPNTARAFAALSAEWVKLRAGTFEAVTPESAIELSRQGDVVLVAAERLTRAIEDETKPAGGRLVNLAGRQRMLSQRVAKNYMLRSWGIESSALREELESSVNEFSGGLAALRGRSENTDDIRRELDDISLQWEWLQAALSAEGAVSYRLIVAEAADSILESADRVTRLYEQQGRR